MIRQKLSITRTKIIPITKILLSYHSLIYVTMIEVSDLSTLLVFIFHKLQTVTGSVYLLIDSALFICCLL